MRDDPHEHDVDLLLAIRSGDTVAFSRLYLRHSVVVLRFTWSKLGERAAAEDVTQETFAILWSKRASASIVSDSLLPWILTVARNLVRNELRKNTRRGTVVRDLPELAGSPSAHEDLAWMRREFAKLSDIDQTLCRLCLVEGLTFRQAADLVESSEAAVSKRVQRARARLRIALGSDELGK